MKLTEKQHKMIVERTKDTTAPKYEIIKRAGYQVDTTTQKGKQVASQIYGENMKKPEIQRRIDQALESQGATPEFAVSVLKSVANQEKEIGARRLAAKDILELNGYKSGNSGKVELNIDKGFFKVSR
jgi:hypothetical protein